MKGIPVLLCSSSKVTLLWSPTPLGLPETLKTTGQMQQRTGVSLEQLREAYHHSNFLCRTNKWSLPHTATQTLGLCLCSHYEPDGNKHLSIQPNSFLISVLTRFGKVFPVITEILEEGDTLTARVVPPRCLQKHHLHTGSRPQTGTRKAGLGMGHLRSPPGCLEAPAGDSPALALPSPLGLASHLDRRGLQQGDLVLPAELQEARQLFGKINDLLHGDDGELGEVGKALLTGLPALGIWGHGPRLPSRARTERTNCTESASKKPPGALGTATSPQFPRLP